MTIEATSKLNQLHALLLTLTGPDGLDHLQSSESDSLLSLALELVVSVRGLLSEPPASGLQAN